MSVFSTTTPRHESNSSNNVTAEVVTKVPRIKFSWNDDNTSLFLTLLSKKDDASSGKKSNNRLLESVAEEMRLLGYEVTTVQLKNRLAILRGEYLAIRKHKEGSGNDPYPNEPSYMLLFNDVFGKKHNALPPVLSSSDGGTVVSVSISGGSGGSKKKTIPNSDTVTGPNDDEGQSSEEDAGNDRSSKSDKGKKRKTVPHTAKAISEVQTLLGEYSKKAAENREESLALLRSGVDDARKYREQSLVLKKEANVMRVKKFKLLKKMFDNNS